MVNRALLPTVGARVGILDNSSAVGTVVDTDEYSETGHVVVRWSANKHREAVLLEQLEPRFERSMEVLDVPRTAGQASLGEGYVVAMRRLGGSDQVLVHFRASGRSVWVPWQNLRRLETVHQRLLMRRFEAENSVERFRLRSLARAIEQWNANTGALTRMEIDPLPHQIHLVHHILASGNLNWLIADDVGLGKTIEVGMLLSALDARRQAKRVLLVTPAGLVRQWQEELSRKFGLNDFRLYGDEFTISHPEHWKQHDRVIASMDRLKSTAHLESIMQAEPWDLIVFDEAHRLSRTQIGMSFSASDRYELASALRDRSESLLLLSATPHQGRQDRFLALLQLLRPELTDALNKVERDPALLAEMVFRNQKEKVRHMDGSLVFKGKLVSRIEVPQSEQERTFDRDLQRYFKQGYASADRAVGRRTAIGFVMTMYRKLAASSVDAIRIALERRLHRLASEFAAHANETSDFDVRFEGEFDELRLGQVDVDKEFFSGESRMLAELVEQARLLSAVDSKLRVFLSLVRDQLANAGHDGRIVVFTEYRATQKALVALLQSEFGEGAVAQINGGQRFSEREQAIKLFETSARFLVSTEAGGEGLNMQRRCHVMINYDLPWNPMRLVQRIGRLYRYGQNKPVVVFNLVAQQTVDERVIAVMYERLDQVIADLSGVSDDYGAGLQSEWLGEIAELLDVADILERAEQLGDVRTRAAIDDAIGEAAKVAAQQRELFEYVAGFNPDELIGQLTIGSEHLRSFVLGMCRIHELTVEKLRGSTGIWRIKLDETARKNTSLTGRVLLICFDRSLSHANPEIHMIDMESSFLKWLLKLTRQYEFGGRCVAFNDSSVEVYMTAMLRWQDARGRRRREEFLAVGVDDAGVSRDNPQEFIEWLLSEGTPSIASIERSEAEAWLNQVHKVCNSKLAHRSTEFLHPESIELLGAAVNGKRGS